MEDLIYFILLIAWVVYAFYRRSQKRSARASRPVSGREPEAGASPQPTLEDILFGEEEEIPSPGPYQGKTTWIDEGEYSPQPVETSFEREYNLQGITSVEERVATTKINEIRLSDLKNDEISGQEDMKDPAHEIFDPRKAVIYSEILNRPYV
jgi:hypothetical protein